MLTNCPYGIDWRQTYTSVNQNFRNQDLIKLKKKMFIWGLLRLQLRETQIEETLELCSTTLKREEDQNYKVSYMS